MSETTDKPKLGTRAPLGLKRTVETGKVKQSFSHGRSNTVVVEVKKRRILGRPGEVEAPKAEPAAPEPAPVARAPEPKAAPKQAAPTLDATTTRRELQDKLLREAEGDRQSALEEARRREEKQAKDATEDEKRRAEENRRAEEEAAVARDAAVEAEEPAPQTQPEPGPVLPQP
ncbi:MAG TPA: IF-2-associated domain-containing protein, partial [Allosphingosinicella sp.]|nr:IF-2-associated domain-containing protein [Allosphingosinicella sp.]